MVLFFRATCQCNQGYTAVGQYCHEINPCKLISHSCHVDARCVHTGPGLSECRCDDGWVGDGYYCYPSTPCRDHKVCHDNATCVERSPGKVQIYTISENLNKICMSDFKLSVVFHTFSRNFMDFCQFFFLMTEKEIHNCNLASITLKAVAIKKNLSVKVMLFVFRY